MKAADVFADTGLFRYLTVKHGMMAKPVVTERRAEDSNLHAIFIAPHFESRALFPESPVTTTSNRLSPLPHYTVRWHKYGHSRAERLTQMLTLDGLGVGPLSARILLPFRGAA